MLNRLRWPVRLPIKWTIFALATVAVCFPNPALLVRHFRHWQDPEALIEPDTPTLQPLWEELRPQLHDDLPPGEVLELVERFVYKAIPYEWDWNTWGTADYLPTVAEAIRMGKEDCDGRAVVAASLLRRSGIEAQLVSDFAHVWVQTDHGEIMGPGGRKAIIATPDGPRFRLGALGELPRALAFGVAVFPWPREAILLAVMWLLMLRPGGGAARALSGLALLITALVCLRWGGRGFRQPILWLQWSGVACAIGGFCLMLPYSRRTGRRAALVERFVPDKKPAPDTRRE